MRELPAEYETPISASRLGRLGFRSCLWLALGWALAGSALRAELVVGLPNDDVRCRHLGEDHVQQRGHIVRGDKVRVAPAPDVVDAHVNQEQVGRDVGQGLRQGKQGVVGRRDIAMSRGLAGVSDDRPVHAFVPRQGKGRRVVETQRPRLVYAYPLVCSSGCR